MNTHAKVRLNIESDEEVEEEEEVEHNEMHGERFICKNFFFSFEYISQVYITLSFYLIK